MKHFLKAAGLALALLVSVIGFAPSAEAGSSDVSYKVTDVVLNGDKITFTGNFINNSDNYQRVLKIDLKYLLSDMEGYPLLSGTRRIGDLSVDVGGDPTPFSFTVDDSHGHEFQTQDIGVWKIETDIEIE